MKLINIPTTYTFRVPWCSEDKKYLIQSSASMVLNVDLISSISTFKKDDSMLKGFVLIQAHNSSFYMTECDFSLYLLPILRNHSETLFTIDV